MSRTTVSRFINAVALAAGFTISLPAFAIDVTSSTTITASAPIFRSASNTFAAKVTVSNSGQAALTAPLRLVVLVTPATVGVANKTGVMVDGRPYIEIPLPSGQLEPSASVGVTVNISGSAGSAFTLSFAVDDSSVDSGGLPPDPGEAGKATLLGVDSDGDGVRDDVQRWIALTYASDPVAILALRNLSKTLQQKLAVVDGDSATAKALYAKASQNRSCLLFLYDLEEGSQRAHRLFAEQFNTKERYRAWSKQNDLLAGMAFESHRDRSQHCGGQQ